MDLAMFQPTSDDLSAYCTLSHNIILNINFVWLTLVDILICTPCVFALVNENMFV